ncbi:nucleotide cyclase [Gaertneriomyces semiglobifer]|nr:nucleotide cyclase [Gaertneriomyces semiglobifer]
MAFWNAPLFLEEHAIIACEAALKSQERLKELRENWLQKGYPEIRARIGLNTGPALVGNLGSPSRLNYTCLGDTVNLASRLEGLNKRYNTSIIVSDAVRDQVHEYFVLRPLDYVAVKGKTVAKKCYELVDTLDACDPVVLRRVALYEKAFDLYCQADFEQAKALFEAYLVDVPWDVPAIMHLEECIRLEEEGVPHNWSPVVVLDEK